MLLKETSGIVFNGLNYSYNKGEHSNNQDIIITIEQIYETDKGSAHTIPLKTDYA